MAHKKVVAPDVLAEARRLYEQTLAPVDDIAAMMGMTSRTMYGIARREGWRGRRAKVAASHFIRALSRDGAAALIAAPIAAADQRRAPIEPEPPPATAEQRLMLAQKLQGAIGDQIDAIKHVQKLVGAQEQLDDGARGLAAVSRSLRETHELLQPPAAEKKSSAADDEPFPYDIEQFRQELARALRGILAERRNRTARESEQSARGPEGTRSREAED